MGILLEATSGAMTILREEAARAFPREACGLLFGQNVFGRGARIERAVGAANVRGGRAVDLSYQHGWSDIVFEDYGGVDVDDGQFMDKYQYNRFEVLWAEHLPMTDFGWKALNFVEKARHTVQITADVGVVDRNVHYQDEFRAGGTHPYFVGSGNIRPAGATSAQVSPRKRKPSVSRKRMASRLAWSTSIARWRVPNSAAFRASSSASSRPMPRRRHVGSTLMSP